MDVGARGELMYHTKGLHYVPWNKRLTVGSDRVKSSWSSRIWWVKAYWFYFRYQQDNYTSEVTLLNPTQPIPWSCLVLTSKTRQLMCQLNFTPFSGRGNRTSITLSYTVLTVTSKSYHNYTINWPSAIYHCCGCKAINASYKRTVILLKGATVWHRL